ncbi:Ig-like domain-containing protein [Pseudonocardia nematodicida]|uniref:Ig-like domain-containing protein n=1 Tax=Pseudonocardia nematodicida TaxID=1206997 RepID=A0ABV1K789_9PSEU
MSRSWGDSRGRHTPDRRRRPVRRRTLATLLTGLAVLAVLIASGSMAVADGRIGESIARGISSAVDGFGPGPRAAPAVPVTRSTTPRPGPPVAPRGPAQVFVTDGTLEGVALTGDGVDGEGGPVPGGLSPDGRTWTATAPLDYATTYRWSGTWVIGDEPRPLPEDAFTTVDPATTITGTMNIRDGGTVGVAAPVVLSFPASLSDEAKATVEEELTVETSAPVEGGWAWLPDTAEGSRVHYRPREYWPSGTEVTVRGTLRGLDLGEAGWVTDDVDRTFSIGPTRITRADTQSHGITVIEDGKEIARYDASYGLESDPRRVTRSGVHVVMAKSETVYMSNPDYGYVNERHHWAVRISNNGEFIHANPGSTYAQGNSNVSHGCINLSTRDAQEYFGLVEFGDPVEVVGSSQPLTERDGDFYDWTIPWEDWLSMSALARP